VDGRGLNFMLSIVKGVEPKDQVEAMLAAQMAAVRNAIMTFVCRLAHVETIQQQDSVRAGYNRARTHLSLNKDAPVPRAIQAVGGIHVNPILGGLHHHYARI
jgi:hypothetical protein